MTYSKQAVAALQQGDFDHGQELLQQALQHDSVDDLYETAQQLQQSGLVDSAILVYRALLKQLPQEDILKVNLAETLISNDEVDEATNLLAQITADSPAYVAALMVSADLYQTLGLYEVSEQKLQQALKLAPQEQVIQFALAELYFNENQFQQAADYYEQLIDQDVFEFSGISLYQRLAASQMGLGDYEAAETSYQHTTPEFLNADNLYNYANLELELKHYQQAQTLIEQLLQLAPDYTSGYILESRLNLAQNKPAAAFKAAQQGLSYDPYSELLYELVATSAQQIGDLVPAVTLLKQGLQMLDAPTSLILALSQIYLLKDEHQANLDLLDQYADQLRDDGQAQWNRARSLSALEQISAAKTAFLSVYDQFKDNPNYLKDLITLLRKSADPDLLKNAVHNYLQLVPDDWEMNELEQELNLNNED